uniref:Uncharacterized protein n=1 Tax=Phlebotomus papatasi TaxID=29031 RepID=A0A1B0D7E4_PHLPP
MDVRLVLILFHFFLTSWAISVRDYASSKLEEHAVRELPQKIDTGPLEEEKFSMTTFNVHFDCKNTFEGRIIQTELNLLLLSGPRLYVINTNSSGSTLDELAVLGDVKSSPLNIQATFWTKEKIIVVVAFSTHYNIYKVPFNTSGESIFLPPIQKISIIEEIPVKIALYRRKEELYCLLVSKISGHRGILRLFNWHLMHFKEEVQRYVSWMSDLLHINWQDNEKAAIASIYYGREKVEIHLLDGYNLQQFQTLHVHGKFIRFVQLLGRVFLLICPSIHCDVYRWSERRFNHWRRVNLPSDFHEFHTGHNVIIYRFNHTMFVSNRVDLTPIGTINCTTARIYLHKMHDSQTIWAVSVFLEPPQLRLNFIEISQNAIETDSEESSGRHLEDEASFTKFLQCANMLKSQFHTIYGAITKIASLNRTILRRDRPVEISGKLIVKNVTRIRENGNVDGANVAIGIVSTPTELLKNVAQLNLRKLKLQTEIEKVSEMFSNALHNSTQRFSRDVESGKNGTNYGEKLSSIRRQKIRVGNLRTNSDKWVNLLLKKSPKSQHLNISWLKSLRATNLNISANVNGINITQDIYNQSLVQNKIVNFFHCKHLIVKNTINSIHINDFFGLFAKGRSHNSPSFHVDQVIVENIQEMNFDTFYQSLFLQNTSREIDGNLIFYNVTTVKDLEVRTINGKATNDLVTLHTNQIINSTIRINQFRVEHFVTDTVNDIKFRRENLALIGKDNHFE